MTNKLHESLLGHNHHVPRYTSYPTTPNFKDTVDRNCATEWLSSAPKEGALSLYFHIPFCKELCWYCGCNTKATRQYKPVSSFLNDLKHEISLVTHALGATHDVRHIHFGGGSPSYLTPNDFTALFEHIKQHFNVLPNAEVAIELDPREITEAKIAAYAKAGVNRASLGVQDFNSTVQKAINRVQPFHRVYQAVEMLRQYGIKKISFDLLYGLPHQTSESILDTVALATAMDPDRISLFGYAHVPWMKKHMRLIEDEALPKAEERLRQSDAARKKLKQYGYTAVGLDHFAKPTDTLALALNSNQLKRNFQGYTTDASETLIGFGPSAISAFKQGYVQNTPDLRTYSQAIHTGKLAVVKGIRLKKDDETRREVISKIMCYGFVDLNSIANLGTYYYDYFSEELQQIQQLENDNLVWCDEGKITVNPDAVQASRLLASIFDTYLRPVKKMHAQVA